jgi:protein-L-isoaspartate(D-aspartate) O-methyltransferase
MTTTSADAAPFETMRHAMVASQLRTSGVSDARVVEAMARVPREDFVPADQRALAYRDTLIPAGAGRRLNSPLATGLLLTQAAIRPDDKVLLVGAGGGYAAALLALLANKVVAIEEDASLAALARGALAKDPGVELVEGPLVQGSKAGAPYDVLVVDGAVEQLPDALVQQLKVGGRAVAGVVDRGVTRLAAGRRTEGGFALVDFVDIECALLPGFARPRTFQF